MCLNGQHRARFAHQETQLREGRALQVKLLLFVFMVLFYLGAFVSAFWAVQIYREMSWPVSQAVVLETTLEDRYQDYKYVFVKYEFSLDKQKFVKVENLGSFHPPKLNEILQKYSRGNAIDIAYEPEHPSHSMLKSESNSLILIVVAILPLVLSLLGYLMFRQLRKGT